MPNEKFIRRLVKALEDHGLKVEKTHNVKLNLGKSPVLVLAEVVERVRDGHDAGEKGKT